MSRKGNCWDNSPQESFLGRMKDHVKDKIKECVEFSQVSSIVNNYMEYYNKEKYQWGLVKLSPDEFYKFYITCEYSLKIRNFPPAPVPQKLKSELGITKPIKENGKATE